MRNTDINFGFAGYLDKDNGLGNELLNFSIIEEGGKFIAHESLKQHLSSVIKCVSNFVDFGDGSNRYTSFDSDVYKVLPKMYVEIANNSRIDSGYRLLMRCVRHAVDSKAHKIDRAKFVIQHRQLRRFTITN